MACLLPLPIYRGFLATRRKKPFENIEAKGENAGNQHFLLFSTMFSTFSDTNSLIRAMLIP